MTDEQIKAWKVERDMARAINNETDRHIALQKCYDHRDEMMMTCIAHQSERVKVIMKDHDDMVKSHKEYRQELAERKAIKKAFTFIKYAATLFGGGGIGAAIVKFIGGV